MGTYTKEKIKQLKFERIGTVRNNNQGYPMKCVEYIDSKHIVVEFQDEFKERHNATWQQFLHGEIKNNSKNNASNGLIYGVGIRDDKYPISLNGKKVKEYVLWNKMLERCYSPKVSERNPTYINTRCSKEFLLYSSFYDWLHLQDNWEYLIDNDIKFNLDKDILIKGNKVYSPETCCLVPQNVNSLFIKRDASRGDFPIGVSKRRSKYCAQWSNNKGQKLRIDGIETPEKAFQIYKREKENVIKQVAQEEYDKGTIIKACYEAMMKYEVEITD